MQFVRSLFRGAPATALITVVCLGVFVITALQSHSISNVVWGSSLAENMVLFGPFIDAPSATFRTLLAGFLHVDISHVAVNMITLALLGPQLERRLGTGPYSLLYAAGVLGSSASVLEWNFDVPTVGASGALYMLMGVLLALSMRQKVNVRAPLALVGANLAYSVLSPGISLWGHLGGLVVGLLAGWPVTSVKKRVRWLASALAAVAAVAAVALVIGVA
ncbi:rhomboid family intramembrane serine protease [Corynebacterium sp. CCUG 18816]|uniref:rhomboid family intramembrane serine protease n=1 Tax=Corynebacterium pseudogenitalium TaxID=38303 RepID=UPI00210C8D29|nr:rhomboid family intramembrane serine protease [Corynebacterium pseudogenitalium]MCQ4617253.1 rhomboid family intramembrane serine protease [Corynebacterium pseudogenitalium]